MSRVDRLTGLLRSLAIYHGIPLRQRRLRRLYRRFVARGDLAFDLGAHAGNHTRALSALGCRVVAVEPQPDFAGLLRTVFRLSLQVTVLEAAVAELPGRTILSISERTPTVSTSAAGWRETRGRQADFAGVQWSRQIDVEVTTLDALIGRFGVPAFVKIDVEGSEPAVLTGLSQPLRAISFEYLPRTIEYVQACLTRLDDLGPYRYNWSVGESYRLQAARWMSGPELVDALGTPVAQRCAGDVYALLVRSREPVRCGEAPDRARRRTHGRTGRPPDRPSSLPVRSRPATRHQGSPQPAGWQGCPGARPPAAARARRPRHRERGHARPLLAQGLHHHRRQPLR